MAYNSGFEAVLNYATIFYIENNPIEDILRNDAFHPNIGDIFHQRDTCGMKTVCFYSTVTPQ